MNIIDVEVEGTLESNTTLFDTTECKRRSADAKINYNSFFLSSKKVMTLMTLIGDVCYDIY